MVGKQGIYKIQCILNDKVYVGATSDLVRREKTHFCNLRLNKHINSKLQADFNEFGGQNFKWEILELVEDAKILYQKENEWKAKFINIYNMNKTRKLPILTESDICRFWSKVNKADGCWIWSGCCKPYGNLKINKQNIKANRLSYYIHNGNFDETLVVMHKCNNKKCVNPDHLELGTHIDNMRAASSDGLISKLSLVLATEIRDKYKELGKNSTKYIKKWLFDTYGMTLVTSAICAILNNTSYYDENYISPERHVGGLSRADGHGKITVEIANFVRKLYENKITYKNINYCVLDTFGVSLSKNSLIKICMNRVFSDNTHIKN